MTDQVTGVLVFDGRPKSAAIVRKSMFGALVTSSTGPRGADGLGVILLEADQNVPPPETPVGTLVYRKKI